jgi:hypothetical protein
MLAPKTQEAKMSNKYRQQVQQIVRDREEKMKEILRQIEEEYTTIFEPQQQQKYGLARTILFLVIFSLLVACTLSIFY